MDEQRLAAMEATLSRIEQRLVLVEAHAQRLQQMAVTGACAGNCGGPYTHAFVLPDGRCSACGKYKALTTSAVR